MKTKKEEPLRCQQQFSNFSALQLRKMWADGLDIKWALLFYLHLNCQLDSGWVQSVRYQQVVNFFDIPGIRRCHASDVRRAHEALVWEGYLNQNLSDDRKQPGRITITGTLLTYSFTKHLIYHAKDEVRARMSDEERDAYKEMLQIIHDLISNGRILKFIDMAKYYVHAHEMLNKKRTQPDARRNGHPEQNGTSTAQDEIELLTRLLVSGPETFTNHKTLIKEQAAHVNVEPPVL